MPCHASIRVPFLSLRAGLLLVPFALVACAGSGTSDTGKKHPNHGDDTAPAGTDADGDGYIATSDGGDDCDDGDPSVNPGATEACNGVDDNCDGNIDEGVPATYTDADGDGYGDPNSPLACSDPNGVTNSADCNDTDPLAFPGADEVCNGHDDNCDGHVDENLPIVTSYADLDGDGSGDPTNTTTDCQVPAGYVANSDDCDDTDARNPQWVQTWGRYGGSGTIADPVSTIQAAIDSYATCVLVGPGAYYESVNFDGLNPSVKSTDGQATTWIYANGGPAVTFQSSEDATATLDGFSISGSYGYATEYDSYYDSAPYYYYYETYYYGGGIYILYASPTLRNLTITDSVLPLYSYSYSTSSDGYTAYQYDTNSYGGGVYVGGGSPTLTDVTFTGDQASYGGGMYVDSYAALTGTRLKFYGDYAGYGAALDAGYEDTVNLTNVIVDATTSEYEIGTIYAGYLSTLTLDHATIVSNSVGVYGDYEATINVSNSIIAGNDYGIYNASSDGPATFNLSYNDVYTNSRSNYYSITDPTGTNGNIESPPKFTSYADDTDYASDVLTLQHASGCVGTGDPTQTDADGSTDDMGAYGGKNGVWP